MKNDCLTTTFVPKFSGASKIFSLLLPLAFSSLSACKSVINSPLKAPADLNNAPLAEDQSLEVDDTETLSITLEGSDPDGDSLSYQILSEPVYGILSGTAPDLFYTPTSPYTGTDALSTESISFEVSDSKGKTSNGTVTLTVNRIRYNVSSSGTNVTMSPSGVQTVNHGTTLALTVTADSFHNLVGTVGGDCPAGSWSGNSYYTTGPITAACSVEFSAWAHMYFCDTMSDGLWQTVGNWNLNSDCSSDPAGRVPMTGDFVHIEQDFNDSAGILILRGYIGKGSVVFGHTANLSIVEGGPLQLSGMFRYWEGISAATVTAAFTNAAYGDGTVLGNATFDGVDIRNGGTVSGNATFYSSSYNTGTVSGDATFDGINNGIPGGGFPGTVGGNATFLGVGKNTLGSTVVGHATFYGTGWNAGSVGLDGTFYDTTTNYGAVTGNATFNDSSFNDGGTYSTCTGNNVALLPAGGC